MLPFIKIRNPNYAVIRLLSVLLLLDVGFAEDWPGFRGPGGMGLSSESDLPLKWSATGEGVLWKVPLPPTEAKGLAGHNQSAPVVADDRVFVTTVHWPAETADRKALQPIHVVACYAAKDGALLWKREVTPGPWILKDLRGGYAAPTPAVASGRVLALFGSSILHSLDIKTGKVIWSYTIKNHQNFDVALSTSPVVYGENVILLLDKKPGASILVSLDVVSGKVIWEKARPETSFSHMTPVIIEVKNQAQLIVGATKQLQGIDPKNGEVIWSAKWGRGIWPVSSPVVAKGLIYAIGGRGGHPGLVVDPTGTGDISGTHVKWKIGPMSEGLSSPVVFEDRVFRIHSPGVLECVHIQTGEELYKVRLQGISPSVSPFVTPEGRVYFASAGKTIVLDGTAKSLTIIAESDLGDASLAAASVSNGRIFLKGKEFLWAIGKQ